MPIKRDLRETPHVFLNFRIASRFGVTTMVGFGSGPVGVGLDGLEVVGSTAGGSISARVSVCGPLVVSIGLWS